MEDKIFNLAFSVVEKEKRSGLAALICVDSCLTPRFSHFSQIYFHLYSSLAEFDSSSEETL